MGIGFLPMGESTVMLSRTALTEAASFFRSAEHELTGEVFLLMEHGTAREITRMSERGVAQRLLLDPEYGPKTAAQLAHLPGVDLATYGEMPLKNHAKIFHTGDRSLITTGAFTNATSGRLEFTVQLQGDAAAAARELTESAISGDKARMTAALHSANEYGIALNDSIAGEQLLTKRLFDMIDHAEHELTISTKIYTDPGIRQAVQRAESRGVNVLFTDIRDKGMHGTLVIADNDVYMGTAHLSPRALGDMRYAYRKAREVGVFARDSDLALTLRTQLDREGMRAYTPEQFERTRLAFNDMDGLHKLEQQVERLGDKPGMAERIAGARVKADAARVEWNTVKDEVREARRADGITFAPPAERQAVLGDARVMELAPQAPAPPNAPPPPRDLNVAEPIVGELNIADPAATSHLRRNLIIGAGTAGVAGAGVAAYKLTS